MAETARSKTDLQGILADNTIADISPEDVRDLMTTNYGRNYVTTVAVTPYAPTQDDVYLATDATAGIVTINLPTTSDNGRVFTVSKVDTTSNSVIIAAGGSDTVGLNTTLVLPHQYDSVTLIRRGTAWDVVNIHRTTDTTIHVELFGSDTAGDGSIFAPFASTTAALAFITDASSVKRHVILVGPGQYSEVNPIQMKEYVDIIGVGGTTATKIVAQTSSSDLFTAIGNTTISGLDLSGTTTATAINMSVAGILFVNFCSITDCQTGVLVNNTGTEVHLDSIVGFTNTSTITDLIKILAGGVDCKLPRVSGNSDITNVFSIDGVNSFSNLTGLATNSDQVSYAVKATGGCNLKIFSHRSTSSSATKLLAGIVAQGTNTYVDLVGASIGASVDGILVESGAKVHATSAIIEACTNGVRVNNTSALELYGSVIKESTTWDISVTSATGSIIGAGNTVSNNKLNIDPSATIILEHVSIDEGDAGLEIKGEFHSGSPEFPTESCFGTGDSYVRGMTVLTTDSTATSTTDGGNLTDVSTSAQSASGSTFSFQGVGADHTILVGSSLANASDVLQTYGIKVSQTTAAVEATPKSFLFEYWNGAAWVEITVMTTGSSTYYRYGNEVFIRANSSEHIRFNQNIEADWTKKTIDSKNLFWVRIRIDTTITTAPVFEQFKLSSDRTELNATGFRTMHAKARFRSTLQSSGNIFGESGAVASGDIEVGSGGIPTGWDHYVKNSLMNGAGDAIYFQSTIPKGTDTSCPMNVTVTYMVYKTPSATDINMIVSAIPVEVAGVLVADPTGGLTPTARTFANTERADAKVGVSSSVDIDINSENKVGLFTVDALLDLSNHYEGDMLFIRIEMNSTPGAAQDLLVLTAELDVVKWSDGQVA